jgi:hypothetical protein
VLLFAVETGLSFANSIYVDHGPFYSSLENLYRDALAHLHKHGLLAQFTGRCRRIMEQSEGFGWGFSDVMLDLYLTYFDDADEDD